MSLKYVKWLGIRKVFKREIATYRIALSDSRTPLMAKIFLGLAVGYAVLPFDIIPDFIPIVGQLDDLILLPVLLLIARAFIPKEVLSDARKKAGMS